MQFSSGVQLVKFWRKNRHFKIEKNIFLNRFKWSYIHCSKANNHFSTHFITKCADDNINWYKSFHNFFYTFDNELFPKKLWKCTYFLLIRHKSFLNFVKLLITHFFITNNKIFINPKLLYGYTLLKIMKFCITNFANFHNSLTLFFWKLWTFSQFL